MTTPPAAAPPSAATELTAPPELDISSLTSSQAGELLDRLTAEYKSRQGAPDVFGLSPKEADAKLAELAKQAAKAAADPIGAALAGELPPDGVATTGLEGGLAPRKMLDTVDALRAAGHSDEVIRQVLDGRPVSRQEHDLARTCLQQLTSDREWCEKYLAGDAFARKLADLALISLSSPIKGARP